MPELEGKAAIITGASRGIGAATARELAQHGVSVCLVARTGTMIEALAADLGAAETVTGDIADEAVMKEAVKRCQDRFGRLDILVNNAALIEPIGRIADVDSAGWTRVMDVNVNGVFFGLKAAIPVMLQQGGGQIINVSSGAAVNPLEGWSHYCASKAAVLMLTRSVHLEYASRGIRIIGVSPGTVRTGMQVAIKASGLNPISQMEPDDHMPPEWAARGIAWLCSDAARIHDGGDVSLRDPVIRGNAGLL